MNVAPNGWFRLAGPRSLDLGVELLPAPHATVLACARESAASRGVEIRTVG